MELKREDIDEWRGRLDTLASDTRVSKRFQLSPNGRYVVTVRTVPVYDGYDMRTAIDAYNAANP